MSRRRSTNVPPRFAYNHTRPFIPGTEWKDPPKIQYPTWLSCESHRKQKESINAKGQITDNYRCVQDEDARPDSLFVIRDKNDNYDMKEYLNSLNICNRDCFPRGCFLHSECTGTRREEHKAIIKAMNAAIDAAQATEEDRKAKLVLGSSIATDKKTEKAKTMQSKADDISRNVLLKPHQTRTDAIYKVFQCDPTSNGVPMCSERSDFTDQILSAVLDIEVAFDMEEYAESLKSTKKKLLLQRSDYIIEEALTKLDDVYTQITAWTKKQNPVIMKFIDKVLELYNTLSTEKSSSPDADSIIFADFFKSDEVHEMYKLQQHVIRETLNMQMFTGLKHEKGLTRFYNNVMIVMDLCAFLLGYENFIRLQKSGYVWAGTEKNYVSTFIDSSAYKTTKLERLENLIQNAQILTLIPTKIPNQIEQGMKRLEKVVILLKNLVNSSKSAKNH